MSFNFESSKIRERLKVVWEESLLLILSFGIGIIFILVLVLLLPIFIFRFFIFITYKLVRPDLSSMLSPRSVVVGASDDFYTKPLYTIVIEASMDNCIDLGNLQTRLEKKLLKLWTVNGKFLALKQKIVTWMGFHFLQSVDNFVIGNYVKYANVFKPFDPVDERKLVQMKEMLATKPFIPGESLWEILLVPHYKDFNGAMRSIVIMRIHHALVDGFSATMLAFSLSNNCEIKRLPWPESNENPITKYGKILFTWLILPFALPYQQLTLKHLNDGVGCVRNLRKETLWTFSQKIPLRKLKEIKSNLKVSVNSVIVAGVAATIRKLLIKRELQLPSFVSLFIPFPLPNHREELCNYLTFTLLPIPIKEPDSLKRTRIIHENLKRAKQSVLPLVNSWSPIILGSLPTWIIGPLTKTVPMAVGKVGLSNFPGPVGPIDLCGFGINEIQFYMGPLPGASSVEFTAVSYNGLVRFAFGVDKSIFSDREIVDVLGENLTLELNVLQQYAYI